MNPSQPEGLGLKLPTPPEQTPAPEEQGELQTDTAEQVAGREQAPRPAAPPIPPPPIAAIPLAAPQAAVPATDAAAASTSLITDDDLIEKEWVNKAKQIVEQTRDDPYRKNEEITVFKADYMKKHYGKTIKLSR